MDPSMSERSDQDRVIDLSVEVPGSPEEVWRAIATGPGITSWFVPHEVDEGEGGGVRMDFGAGFGEESARVAAWEPPHRLLLQGNGERALAYEWLVEARAGGSCIVRLVSTGFGPGEDWDAEYHGMSEGWRLFLENLRLHLTHFPGQRARAVIPTRTVSGTRDSAFEAVCAALGVSADLAAGDRLEASTAGGPPLAGRVYVVVLDDPAPGTAILSAELAGDQVALSLWLYLYGPDASGLPDAWSPFLTALGERLAR
jgi:uncharacterized protein YndB with AHSA1/START domain